MSIIRIIIKMLKSSAAHPMTFKEFYERAENFKREERDRKIDEILRK
jgi:hypothetical protein